MPSAPPRHRPITRRDRARFFACADCRADTSRIGEFAYMLHDRVWKQLVRRAQRHGNGSMEDLCCIGCAEKRLGRPLTRMDFNWSIPLNILDTYRRSDRLRDAMVREPWGDPP